MGARAQDEAPATPTAIVIQGTATHYGSSYNGSPLGCGGTYWGSDPTIVAVGPSRYSEWPCGSQLTVSGPAGSLTVTRQDSCPGCSANMIDLSEAANEAVCGAPAHTCSVSIERN